MGSVTALDVAAAVGAGSGSLAADRTQAWVEGAWQAWAEYHPAVRRRADELTRLLR